ncbi:MAG: DUF86 domain-containing protein [Planctomycetes bacterium]|nr:DUF86 domain-containing protein [Planctomycetota bacterium]
MSRDIVTLTDVYIALVRIREFVAGMTKEEFVSDEKTYSAVLLKLMVIGEAIKRLAPDFRQAHSDVKWKEYAGFRDILIHQYDDVNLETVWDIVTNELPEFFAQVERILPSPPI